MNNDESNLQKQVAAGILSAGGLCSSLMLEQLCKDVVSNDDNTLYDASI